MNVDDLVEGLEQEFDNAERQANGSHRLLWGIIGRIYQEAPAIEANSEDKERLIERIRGKLDERDRAEFRPDLDARDLILIAVLGYRERRSTRTQWKQALEGAKDAGVEPTTDKFVEWIEQRHGIINAGRKVRDVAAGEKRKTRLDAFRTQVEAKMDSLPTLKVDDVPSAPTGFVVLLGSPVEDGIKLIETVGKDSVVNSVISVLLQDRERESVEKKPRRKAA